MTSSRYTPEEQAANQKLERAIHEWVSVCGDLSETGMVDDWVLLMSAEDPENPDTTCYLRASAGGGLPLHRALGLLVHHLDAYQHGPGPD